jgi:hypothetical protein
MLWPPKYKRKLRWRSERQAREIPGWLTKGEGVEEISALTAVYCAISAQMANVPASRELPLAFVPCVIRTLNGRIANGISNGNRYGKMAL